MTALSANSLCLFRGDRCLFKDLNFELQAGELLVIEGPNGSGKTSLMRATAGFLDFESGEVHWMGAPVRDTYQAFRSDVAWLAHRVGFKADLTITENLALERGLRATNDADYDEVLERLALTRLTGLPFRSLSAGQQRRVALARMLLSTARLWMMDEPFTNLDAAGQSLVVELIRSHLADGGMCIAASHQAIEIDGSTRRVSL